jgi:hypothetical protein
MKWSHVAGWMLLGVSLSVGTGCSDADAPSAPGPAQEGEFKTTLPDDQLKAKLARTVEGTNFLSETDEPYHLIEGDGRQVTTITSTVVKKRLAASIKQALGHQIEGIDFARMNSESEDLREWLKNAREGANDASQDKESRDSDRKVAEALQLMLDQLRNVKAFAFGRNESGDGSIVFVFVGRSKTTGRLIGLTTFAAFT